MQGLKVIQQNGQLVALVRCGIDASGKDIAKNLLDIVKSKLDELERVRIIKLGVFDNVDEVYSQIVNNETVNGLIVQDWENIDDLVKLLEGIVNGSIDTEYICA